MSDLVSNLKLPAMVLAVMTIVWLAGNSPGLPDDGYWPTGAAKHAPALPPSSPLNSPQASLRLDE